MRLKEIKGLIYRSPSWMFTVIVVIAILYLTLVPRPLPDMDIPLFPGIDKIVHAIMMMGMMWCICLDLARSHIAAQIRPTKKLAIAFVATVIFGGVIELLQGCMGLGRGEDIYDFLADAIGAFIGLITALIGWEKLVRWLQDE